MNTAVGTQAPAKSEHVLRDDASRQPGGVKVLEKWALTAGAMLAAVLLVAGILLVRNPGSAGQFASNYFAAGEFARGVFASGEFAAGVFAAGTFAVGVFSIGLFSIGLFSVGLFSAGLFGVGLFVFAKYRKPLDITTDVASAPHPDSQDAG